MNFIDNYCSIFIDNSISFKPVYDTDEEEQNEIKKEIEQLHQWKKTGQVTVGSLKYKYFL